MSEAAYINGLLNNALKVILDFGILPKKLLFDVTIIIYWNKMGINTTVME